MILYRPVGLEELVLIYQTGLRAFPPRLPEQPIFYPVLNIEYARQIARDWNAKSGTEAGYVTRFDVEDRYVSQFERHQVGGKTHQELWIPAGRINVFNSHIAGLISVVESYCGPNFRGYMPEGRAWAKKDAVAQFVELAKNLDYSGHDFYGALTSHHEAVFVNYPFWAAHDFSDQAIGLASRNEVLDAIQSIWSGSFPGISLPGTEKA